MDTEPEGRHLSFQALLLSIVGLLLITLGAFGFSTWYALQQWPQLTQSTQSLKTVSTNLSTAFDQYDGTLNMYVSLDPDSGAPPGLQRTTLATAIQDRDNFSAAYRQALRLSRGSPLTGDLTPVETAFNAYQADASLVIRDMQRQHYRQALHLQAIGNVAVSQALASALARFNGDTAQFIQMKESHLQTVLHRMRIVLIFWGVLMLALTGLGLTALRRATRELVQDLLALTHGNFMITRPPAFWKEYALIRHAFLEMRDTIAASFATLVTVTQNQESIIAARTQYLQRYAAGIQEVLRMTAHTMQDWHDADIIPNLYRDFLHTVHAEGWVSIDAASHQENAREGVVPWDGSLLPDSLRIALLGGAPAAGSSRPLPVNHSMEARVFPWRPYRFQRSLLIIMRKVGQRWDDTEQTLVELAVAQMQNMLSAVRLFEDTQRQAEEDSLTGLGNRRRFEGRLEQQTQTMNNQGIPFQLMICDLDHLKIINDSQGHQAGDQALVSLGHALQQHVTDGMEAFRIGGDEFAVVLDSGRISEAHALIRAIHQALPPPLTISAGVAASPAMGTTARVLFMAADWALYEAKERGRDQLYPATLENLLLTLGEPQDTHSAKVLAALVDDHQGRPQDTTATMAQWARDLARDIGCNSEMQRTAELATLLQELVPFVEFAPPGPATIKNHPGDYPQWGAGWLAAYPRLVPISVVLQAHNERWDGAGSPLGLKKTEIPLIARIIAVVDYYSQLVASHRQLRATDSQTEIGNLLEKEAGKSLDPTLVRRWVDRSTHIPHYRNPPS